MEATIYVALIYVALLLWSLIVLHNPRNIRGIVYYKDGNIVTTKVFERFSDFEEYKDAMYENYGNKIFKITWEYENTNSTKE